MSDNKIVLENDIGFLQVAQIDGNTCVSLHARKMGQRIQIGTRLSPSNGFLTSSWPFPDGAEVFYAGCTKGDPQQRFEVKTESKAKIVYGSGQPVLNT